MNILFCWIALPLTVFAGEIPLADCPPAVRATIEKNLRGGQLDEVESHTIQGRTLYVAEVELAGDRELKIHVAADGTLVKTHEDVEFPALPEAVRKAVEARLAGGVVDDVEMENSGDSAIYHIEIEREGAPDLELRVDSGGKVLEEKNGS